MPDLESEESAAERRMKKWHGLKMKLDNYYILCTDQKNLSINYIKVWLTLFKNGNNLHEHWK